MKPRVSMEEVSRLVDGQLTPAERVDVEARLASCAMSRAIKLAFEQLGSRMQQALLQSAPPAPSSSAEGCIDDATLVRLADGTLPEAQSLVVEEHLLGCRHCLVLLMQNLRTARRMAERAWPEIPEEAIRANPSMRSLVNWQERPEEESWEIVRFDPSAGEAQQTFGAGSLSVTVQLTPLDRGGVSIGMVAKEHLRSLAGQEVVVHDPEARRKIFSGRTDAHGRVAIRRVPEGRYQVHFSSSDLRVELVISGA